MSEPATPLIQAAHELVGALAALRFAEPTAYVYNPLEYAWPLHEQYLSRFGAGKKRVVFLGMNPGPWGMAQCGVPFGEIAAVRDWMGISGDVGKPEPEHPKRPIEGLDCTRSEVSGRRLWGLFEEKFGTPETFFAEHFVTNYCPLVWMEEGGKNRTPDKLPAAEMEPVSKACDQHLAAVLSTLEPEWAIGVGAYAEKRIETVAQAAGLSDLKISRILHPSPASPAANRGWAEAAEKQLLEAGVWK